MTDFARRREMMVDTQVRPNDVTKYPVIAAMLHVPREAFVPDSRRDVAYSGENVALGHGRALLEPRSLAKMLDALDLSPDDLVLVVGAGLGYAAAVIGQMTQGVIALEENTDLATEAERRLAAQGADNVAVLRAPLTGGAPAHAPYDAMLLDGAITRFPEALADQLAEGGRVAAIWQEGHLGVARLGHKLDGRIEWRHAFTAYAPVLPGFETRPEFSL